LGGTPLGNVEVGQEPQDVLLAVVEEFQEQAGFALAGVGAVLGGAREADEHTLAEAAA